MTHGFMPKKTPPTPPTPLIAESKCTSLKLFAQIIGRRAWMGSRRCLIVLPKKPADDDGGLLKELCFYFVGVRDSFVLFVCFLSCSLGARSWGCVGFWFCASERQLAGTCRGVQYRARGVLCTLSVCLRTTTLPYGTNGILLFSYSCRRFIDCSNTGRAESASLETIVSACARRDTSGTFHGLNGPNPRA